MKGASIELGASHSYAYAISQKVYIQDILTSLGPNIVVHEYERNSTNDDIPNAIVFTALTP